MAITVTVPPSTTKLTALADLKAILGITDSADDTLLCSIIQRGSDAVARFQSECLMASSRRLPPAKKGPTGETLRQDLSGAYKAQKSSVLAIIGAVSSRFLSS
jgi:hypothetical protein